MSIYIAWGEETLGPYTQSQVAELIECGCLLPSDYAAKDGDPAWVPLSSLLAVDTVPERTPNVPVAPVASRLWPRWLLTGVLAAALLAGGLPSIMRQPKKADTKLTLTSSKPVMRATAPALMDVPIIGTPAPPPAEEAGGRLNGIISLPASDASPVSPRALGIRVYFLRDLDSYLAQKKSAAQAELARLTPLLEAAESERNARMAAEQAARQVFLDTSPSDDLYASLRFAHQQAKGAVKTAEDDCQYYRALRNAVTGGEFYLRDLPAPLTATETNAQGEFTFDLPPGGPFAVVASAQQDTTAGPRTRYWMVRASLADAKAKPLALSESNMTSVVSAESLVQTEE